MLKRVSIQNFKSLKDVTLDLQKVNLLIGPNNSGKTNFLKALEMFDWLVERKTLPEELSRLTFRGSQNEVFIHVTTESIQNVAYRSILHLAVEFRNGYTTAHQWTNNSPDYLSSQNTVPLNEHNLKDVFSYLRIYKPNPELLTKSSLLNSDEFLDADCGNIIPFIFNLSQNHKKVFRNIEENLKKSVGDIVSIGTPAVKSKEANRLRLKFFDQEDNDFWASEVSEGVLYFLALLCIINQPNPPKLLLLEEPEKGIHPRRIEEVINFIFGLADEKDVQVIMTTHSPAVVDMFKDMPESVFIFDKDDEGATHVKNLQKDIIEPETEESTRLGIDPPQYLNGLGQAWKVGFLGGVPK